MKEVDPVAGFWKWFEDHAGEIESAYSRGDIDWLDLEISPRVDEMANGLNWEIGPYFDPENTFVLSPGVRGNLPFTRSAVELAPAMPGWHFVHAKPAKVLNSLVFEACESSVVADDWRYRLTSYRSGEFVDIDLLIDDGCELPSGQEQLFGDLVVESLIGEECRLDRVGVIAVTRVHNVMSEERSTAIRHLPDHLSKVLKP
jgi:hypothetical protein